MIPRIEQKIELSKTDYLMILRWLNFKGAKNIYPERKIISRYFDTSEFMMYQNTLEGIIPRKKIRVRTYCDGDFYDKNSIYNLEKKITTENSRYKSIESNICYPPLRDEGILDDLYGNCFEKIEISYEREYYSLENIRITIDKNISYQYIVENDFMRNSKVFDKSWVMELKASIETNLAYLNNLFPFPRSRFSKYERALYLLFNM